MTDSSPSPEASSSSPATNRSVVKAAGVIGVATFASRVLGLIRDVIIARLFGATAVADAFYVAYRIPNILRELFAEGSMSSAFIPVFTEYRTTRTKQDAWELASAMFTTLLTVVISITILGIIAAPAIAWLIAPGFHDDPEKLAMTTLLTRIMFPYLLFISLAALAMGILNSMRAFAAPALAPVFFNLFIIGCALFLAPQLDDPIIGVAIGVVAGGAAQFAMQLPGLALRKMLFGFRFEPGHPGVRRIGALMLPTLAGLSVAQVNILISTILASNFDGGPTYLFYAMRLIQFPLGIFGIALATAILPTLSTQAAEGALDALRDTLGFGIRMILFIIVPAMVGLMLLRVPIIQLVFQHGAFTSQDTAATAMALLCYAVGLWAFGGVRIIVAAYYSLQDTKTPAIAAVIAVCANLLLSLWLMQSLGFAGLALATALASMLNISILIAILNRRLGGIDWSGIGKSALHILVAVLPILLIGFWVGRSDIWVQSDVWLYQAGMLALAIGGSALGYFGIHALLRTREFLVFLDIVRRKVHRTS